MTRHRSRRQRYADETREALLTTAGELFVERGYARTALSQVAADADVTRGAVYHHFTDKQDLFRAVLEQVESDRQQATAEAYLEHDDPVQGAFAAMNAYLDHGLDPQYAEIVLRQGPIALGWDQWKECEERYTAGLIEQILASLMSAGRIADLPVERLAAITFTALSGCAMDIAASEPADRDRVRRESGDVMVRLLSGLVL